MTRALACLLLLTGCPRGGAVPDAGSPPVLVTLTATAIDTRVTVAESLLAACEMQISGEPLAEAMGRDLGAYSRDFIVPNLNFDKARESSGAWIDLAGFSTGIESYEYSKQAMNNVAFESGAGTSLAYGPLIPDAGLASRVQQFARASNALGRFVFPPDTYPAANASGNVNPFGIGTGDLNPLGWPGLWPTVHVFRSFAPDIAPSGKANLWCAVSSDDSPGASGAAGCADYECDATSLHLPNRDAQVEKVITPGADGYSGWKYALWVLNYLQVMHDSTEVLCAGVDDADLATVGFSGNQIVGVDEDGNPSAPGMYLGSSDVEGFQASMFLEQLNNRFEDWLMALSTADGKTLSGFASLDAAQAYDASAPLRWFPKEIAVTEAPGGRFPRPTYALRSADSALFDLLGMILNAATVATLVDEGNAGVGGAQTARVYFDGDPFVREDVERRTRALLHVALVNLDRLHRDPATGVLVDAVAMDGNVPTRGATVATTSVAYSIVALRTVRRALSAQLQLYSNNLPDRATTAAPEARALLLAQAELLHAKLTDAKGRAFTGWNVQTGRPVNETESLDAHAAAVRGLFAAYLATGDVKYRARAMAVFDRLEKVFYDAEARVYSEAPAPVDSVTYTPMRFALVQAALRETYLLVGARPGNEAFGLLLEDRIGRLNKLWLNGWDDRNGDRMVQFPQECVRVIDGLPRGGLQMAERTLTGEIGAIAENPVPIPRNPTSDREQDCVPELDDAQLPASLARALTLSITRSR